MISICDIQEKFRPAVYEYDKMHVGSVPFPNALLTTARISTTLKLLRAASILEIPFYATTQNAKGLGHVCSEIDLSGAVECVDKTAFSMWQPSIAQHFSSSVPAEIAIVGIESHICVTQTAMDALANGHKVYIISDGVSSCNGEEIPIALARLREEGAIITTSESFTYECMGDAGIPEYVPRRRMHAIARGTNEKQIQADCRTNEGNKHQHEGNYEDTFEQDVVSIGQYCWFLRSV